MWALGRTELCLEAGMFEKLLTQCKRIINNVMKTQCSKTKNSKKWDNHHESTPITDHPVLDPRDATLSHSQNGGPCSSSENFMD